MHYCNAPERIAFAPAVFLMTRLGFWMFLITLQGFCKALRVEKVSDEGCMRDSLAVFKDSHAGCGAKCSMILIKRRIFFVAGQNCMQISPECQALRCIPQNARQLQRACTVARDRSLLLQVITKRVPFLGTVRIRESISLLLRRTVALCS